jgi:hypothetical protein
LRKKFKFYLRNLLSLNPPFFIAILANYSRTIYSMEDLVSVEFFAIVYFDYAILIPLRHGDAIFITTAKY